MRLSDGLSVPRRNTSDAKTPLKLFTIGPGAPRSNGLEGTGNIDAIVAVKDHVEIAIKMGEIGAEINLGERRQLLAREKWVHELRAAHEGRHGRVAEGPVGPRPVQHEH